MGGNQCKSLPFWKCNITAGCKPVSHGLYKWTCEKRTGRMDDQMPDIANMLNHLDVERVLRAVNGNMLDQDEIQG